MIKEPTITVGVMDGQRKIGGRLNGDFSIDGFGLLSGKFSAEMVSGMIALIDEEDHEVVRSDFVQLAAHTGSTFTIFDVIIGISFHWERAEDQTFQGNLTLKARQDGSMSVINQISLEDYLQSVISSEMSPNAPPEFLKTHAILSRSWLLKALERKTQKKDRSASIEKISKNENEIIRWYEQEDHDFFDVCADDHCQRYQGITKIVSQKAAEAVMETRGIVILRNNEICDARFFKACGGLTEEFSSAWDNVNIPYLQSISDAPVTHCPVRTEEDAARWILSRPQAYCNTEDAAILGTILPGFDRETTSFFRWKIEYLREELEDIIREKSGFDFGILKEIQPLSRGSSGRIYRLRIVGTKKEMIVGKELEIRRWLSRSHLYSSAFIVEMEHNVQGDVERFIIHGAGWGHGVGLCQIGAALMAVEGATAEEILKHYFTNVEIRNIY